MIYVMSYENQMKDGDKWIRVGIFEEKAVTHDNTPHIEEIQINSFEELQALAKDCYGIHEETTFFGNKPVVVAVTGWDSEARITEKVFKKHGPIQFRRIWRNFNPSIEWLSKNVSADVFTQYVKDRGMENIVVGR